jgi:hypothetical protein
MYLKEFSVPLYRGEKRSNAFIMKTRRKDRVSRDTPEALHKLLDEVFLDLYGWRARSSGVFVGTDKSTADTYGNAYYFFPIGRYRYLYSKRIRDLYVSLRRRIFNNIRDRVKSREDISKEDELMIREVVKENYTDSGLNDLLMLTQFHTEVMFDCDRYYLLEVPGKNGSSSIDYIFDKL